MGNRAATAPMSTSSRTAAASRSTAGSRSNAAAGGSGGTLDFEAGQNLTITKPILATSGGLDGIGGDIFLTASGITSLQDSIDASGSIGSGGSIEVFGLGNVTITNSFLTDGDLFGGTILITGCAVNVTAPAILSARGAGGLPLGSNNIRAELHDDDRRHAAGDHAQPPGVPIGADAVGHRPRDTGRHGHPQSYPDVLRQLSGDDDHDDAADHHHHARPSTTTTTTLPPTTTTTLPTTTTTLPPTTTTAPPTTTTTTADDDHDVDHHDDHAAHRLR